MTSVSRRQLVHWGAPAAFLAGVTVAVLLVRAGLGGVAPAAGTLGPVTHASSTPAGKPAAATTASTARASTETTLTVGPTVAGAVYHTVQRGETFGSIAASEGTTVAELEALNPSVSSNALSIGQKIGVK